MCVTSFKLNGFRSNDISVGSAIHLTSIELSGLSASETIPSSDQSYGAKSVK